jgi:enamine deaminase RidA (YjgF/YER057c/UK114 family)
VASRGKQRSRDSGLGGARRRGRRGGQDEVLAPEQRRSRATREQYRDVEGRLPYGGRMDRRSARSGSPFEEPMAYSRAVRVGHTVSVSGTAPVWPDGEVDPDPGAQARRCWEIALAALAELDGRPADVIRTRQYVVTADVAEAVGAVHGEVFGDVRPASTMIVIAGLLDPRWLVEVELDAIIP